MMLGQLQQAGARLVDEPEQAETLIVNTCSFIESAADESIETILDLAVHKKSGRCKRLIVTGCLPERYREEIAAAIPEVDFFIGTGGLDTITAAVYGDGPLSKCVLPDPDGVGFPMASPTRITTTGPMAYLKIAEGCSRHCTYCIIPKLRGKQKSRSASDIEAEAAGLLRSGTKELVLVSQETTAYGSDLPDRPTLARLLQRLSSLSVSGEPPAAQDPEYRIRFLYGHPESTGRDLIETVAAAPRICPYFDIPIQHAAAPVLKNMGRRSSMDDLVSLFDTIRTIVPEAALRTTVIVGFPGETDKEFEALLEFIETVRFDHLGCFIYSDSNDLPSHRLPHHVPQAVAAERHHILMRRQQEISLSKNRGYLNQVKRVLIEEKTEEGLYVGRTDFQAPEVDGITHVHAAELDVGQFVDVAITDALEYDLVGEIR